MKKIIALVLSVSMLCTGFAFSASAEKEGEEIAFVPGQEYSGEVYAPTEEINYSESANTVSYSDVSDYSAVGILGALDIMKAAEGGKFKPKAYVSRGEFIEGVLKTFAVRYQDGEFEKNGSFYDVDESNPYCAAIATALSAGFISGYEDNTFRPNEVISYNNAVACLLKAFGFDDNYDQSFANRVRGELMKGITVAEPRAITRMEMAQLLNNALNVSMREVAQFAKIGLFRYIDDEFFKTLTDETVLNYVWHIKRADGLLSANYVESIDGGEAHERSVVIDGERYATEDLNNLDWLGMKVTYYVDRDDQLVYMHKQKKVDELVVEADDVIGFNPSTKVFSYYNEKDKVSTITLNSNYTILYNGKLPESRYTDEIFKIKEGKIRFVANDNEKYTYVFIEEYRNFVMTKFAVNDAEFTFTLGEDMKYFTVDTNHTYLEAYDQSNSRKEIYRKTEEGESIFDTSVFESDSVISVYAPYGAFDASGKLTKTGDFIRIAVSPEKAEGSVKAISQKGDKNVTVDDKTYAVSKSSYISDTDLQTGAVLAFYVDAAGELVAMAEKSEDDGWQYAYLVHIVYEDDRDYPSALKVYSQYGTMDTYKVTQNLKINNKKMKAGKAQETLEASAALIGKPTLKYQQLIKIKTKEEGDSQYITQIQTVVKDYGLPTGYSEDWLERNGSGTYTIASDVGNILRESGKHYGKYSTPKYCFTVPLTEEKEESYFDLRAYSAGNDMQIDLYDVDEYLQPKVGVKYTSVATDKEIYTNYSGNGVSPVMLKDVWSAVDEDGIPILKFEVVQTKGAVEYYSEDLNLLDDYVKGDALVLYGNGTKVSKVVPVTYNGKVIGPNNLPDVTETGKLSISREFGSETFVYELYSVSSAQRAVGQNGVLGSDGKRDTQTIILNDYTAWQMSGLMHYKEENGRAEVMQGSFDQCTEAKQYGSDKATVIIAFMHTGRPRGMLMYTLDR